MQRNIFLTVFFYILLILFVNQVATSLSAEESGCPFEPPESPYNLPGNDHGDDNFSYSSGIARIYNLAPEAVILMKGYYEDALRLFGGLRFDGDNSARKLLEVKPFLVIPSGALYDSEGDSILKHILEEYVRLGGTIIVLAQQYGAHFDKVVPVPEGEILRSYGWREDQSCYSSSAYNDSYHPVLSSWLTGYKIGTMQTDGYFVEYPSTSTVYLRRTKNSYPFLLSYPYGNGTVILGAMFTDWASTHGQSSLTEIRIVRDLATFALNPKKNIPSYDLKVNNRPNIALDVNVTNKTEQTASMVKLTVFDPDRKKVLHQVQNSLTLEAGAETTVNLSFVLPLFTGHGIHHVEYELYDDEGELIQMNAESDGGRFAIHLGDTAYIPDKEYDVWITATDESYFFHEEADITLHVKNYKEEPITINWYYEWGHSENIPIPSLTVPAGEEGELNIKAPFRAFLEEFRELRDFFNLRYQLDGETGFKSNQKGFLVRGIPTVSSIQLKSESPVDPGGALDYVIHSKFHGKPIPGSSTIKLTLEKNSHDASGEAITLYDGLYDFSTNPELQLSGLYTPAAPLPHGYYFMKLDVTTPNGMKEATRYRSLIYERSGFRVKIDRLKNQNGSYAYRLLPGQTYNIPVYLENKSFDNDYNVKNGRYIVKVTAPDGTEVFRKEVNPITISAGEERNQIESFVFNPVTTGEYSLFYAYTDETIGEALQFMEIQKFLYRTDVTITPDKNEYQYLDTAKVTVTVNGLGAYHVKLSSGSAGISEEHDLQVPVGQYSVSEVFDIPIGVQPNYDITVEVQDSTGIKQYEYFTLVSSPMNFDYRGNFTTDHAIAGTDLELGINLKETSGKSLPLSGELVITCPQLNYSSTMPVTLAPLVDNPFSIAIPLAADTPLGTYRFDVQLNIADGALLNRQHFITLSGAEIHFTEPSTLIFNPGDTISFTGKNIGGKDGNFEVGILLKDSLKKEIYSSSQTHQIASGAVQPFTFILPDNLKTGDYYLVLTASETVTNNNTVDSFPLRVNGISATLNSYPLKEKFSANENVSGLAEISTGASIENGSLHAKIIRYAYAEEGTEEEHPGDMIKANLIERAYNANGVIYMVTDKGVIKYDKTLNNSTTLYSFSNNTAFNCSDIMVSSSGELFAAASSNEGVFKWDNTGQLTQFIPDTHLSNYFIRDILEVPGTNGQEMWVAGNGGIDVYRNGTWSTYNTTHGLPSGYIFKIAVDGSGKKWVSTQSGLYTFDGAGFIPENTAPFGAINVSDRFTSDGGGYVWAAVPNNSKLYRYDPNAAPGNEWTEWTFSQITPQNTLYIDQMESINGQLWLRSRIRDANNVETQALINYDGNFNLYPEAEYPGFKDLDWKPLIPGSGDSAFFTSTVGLWEYNSTGSWKHTMMEIDAHKLAGLVYCMAKDSQGNLWAGTEFGFSMYDGNRWHNYPLSLENALLPPVSKIDIDGQDNIYGYCPNRYINTLIKLNRVTETVEFIPMPSGYSAYHSDHIAVEPSGRIWLGRSTLYYYENETWQILNSYSSVDSMAKDPGGGVWVAVYRGYPYQNSLLLFIKNGVIENKYSSQNSGFQNTTKDRLYLDNSGTLWMRSVGGVYSPADRKFQSFDGQNWIDYSTFEGYPQDNYPSTDKGFRNFTHYTGGVLYLIGYDNVLYQLENNGFTPAIGSKVYYNNSMLNYNGKLYIAGNENYNSHHSPSQIVKISVGGGLVEEEYWSKNIDVNLDAGQSTNLNILTGQTLPQGGYVLKTSLLNSIGQQIGLDSDNFVVTGESLSLAMTPQDPSSPYVKAGVPYSTTIDIFNPTSADYNNLRYILKKQSPSGVEAIVKEEYLNIPAGGSHSDSISFSEADTGPWKLIAVIEEDSSGGSGGGGSSESEGRLSMAAATSTVSTALIQSDILLFVAEPKVTLDTSAPQYAGDEPIEIKILLSNTGIIDTSFDVLVQAPGGSTIIDESLSLTAGEEHMLTFTDTLMANKSYTVSVNGDVIQNETFTVEYGYQEDFNIDLQSMYREGPVVIGYTIANTGGLAYVGNVHGELYLTGNSTPIYVFDRSYNLYPLKSGDSPISDTFSLNLLPGNYQLKYNTSKNPLVRTSEFAVQPNGIGTLVLTGLDQSSSYPAGFNTIAYTLNNSDTVAGIITYTITMASSDTPQTPIHSENRSVFIQPGETIEDEIAVNLPQIGKYSVSVTGAKLNAPANGTLNIVALDGTNASINIGAIEKGFIPVETVINNTGYYNFNGRVTIEVQPDNLIYEEAITVTGASTTTQTVNFSTLDLTPGEKTVNALVYDSQFNLVSETSGKVTVIEADAQIINLPENLVIEAGSSANVPMTLVNPGHQKSENVLTLTAFDNMHMAREISLEPGQELNIDNLQVYIPGDLPAGYYSLNYTLANNSNPQNSISGHVDFKVNNVEMDIVANLDRSHYNVGETAQLTLTVYTTSNSSTPFEAVVNWGNFNERRRFELSSGSAVMTFDIPLEEKLDSKVSYGIYHEEGKGIHLNDIYLNFRGDIDVELDKQTYSPGDIVHAVFTSDQTGVLRVRAFDENYTVNLSSSASMTFQVPLETLGGTYGIRWDFTPASNADTSLTGNQLFDVSGLVVKMAKSQLDKDKYTPGETIRANFLFQSNQDDNLELRIWVIAPSGVWEYMGATNVAVSSQIDTATSRAHSFSTTEAGIHKLVYALYKTTSEDELLVLSGNNSFEVGDAILIDIATNRFDYKEGSEPVIVHIDYFGQGNAQMELFLDDNKVSDRSIVLNGVTSTEISLDSNSVSGGSHGLAVKLKKDGLTSTKSTSFIYGTHLPDLTISMVSTENQGLDYTYALSVGNSGQTAATATSLTFSDNDATVTTLSIPALQPGDSHQTVVTWSGNGKAGSHEFVFTADSAGAVKEFNESNNTLSFTEEIPLLFYNLEVDPSIWPANTPVTILTRLINNQTGPAVLTLNMNITNDDTGQTIFQRSQPETLSAFASKTVSDTFDTGVYPAGSYTLSQNISGDGIDLFKDISVYIQATKALSASLTLQPVTISANTPADLELSMNLENTGNVPLENETLFIEVFNIQIQETVHSEEFLVNLPIAGQADEIKVLSLTLDEGQYEVRLRFQETQIAMAPLTVIGGIEKEKTLDIRPRVLIMNLHQTGGGNTGSIAGLQFIAQLLTAYQVKYDTGMGKTDAMVKLHKGYSNITWMLGNLTGQKELDELSQRVWSGDGLIVVRDKADSSQGWSQFLGVKVKQTSAKKRETQFDLLPSSSPLHPNYQLSGQVTLNKAQDLQLEITASDVHVVAQTPAHQYPVITYRPYGHGHILVLSVPIDFNGGTGEISQLFLNAVNLFSKDVYGGTGSDISRLLPIRLNLTNQTTSSRDVNLEEVLPYGVKSYDFDPVPLDDPSGEDKLKWTITVPGSSETPLTYWLRLPDQIGAYEILSRFYTGDWTTVEEEVPLTFEVTQTLTGRIDELLTSLDTLEVNASDSKNLGKAKEYLQKIRSRGMDSDMLSHLEKNVEDAAQASVYLGLIQSADVNAQRLAVTYLLRMLARKHYQIAVPQTQ